MRLLTFTRCPAGGFEFPGGRFRGPFQHAGNENRAGELRRREVNSDRQVKRGDLARTADLLCSETESVAEQTSKMEGAW